MTEQAWLEGLGLSEQPVVPHPGPLESTLSVPLPRTGGITISVPQEAGPTVPIPEIFF